MSEKLKEQDWIWRETQSISLLVIFTRPSANLWTNIFVFLSSFLARMKNFISLFWILNSSCLVLLDQNFLKTYALCLLGPLEDVSFGDLNVLNVRKRLEMLLRQNLCLVLLGPHEDVSLSVLTVLNVLKRLVLLHQNLCLVLLGPHEDGNHLKRHREHNRWVLFWDFWWLLFLRGYFWWLLFFPRDFWWLLFNNFGSIKLTNKGCWGCKTKLSWKLTFLMAVFVIIIIIKITIIINLMI